MKSYDLVVIGAGVAGYTAAKSAAHHGLKVALVEKNIIGGTCVNYGCIPTKTLLYSSCKDTSVPDVHEERSVKLLADINRVVSDLRNGMMEIVEKLGIDYYSASVTECGNNYVTISGIHIDEKIEYKKLIIASGSEPIIPDQVRGINGVITSDDIFEENNILPENLIILGGGVIGVEFASCLSDLGVNVSIIEAEDRLIKAFSSDISRRTEIHLQKKGISLIKNALLQDVSEEDGEVFIRIEDKTSGAIQELLGDRLLIAIGRTPFFDPVLSEGLNIQMKDSVIETDEFCRTSNPDVYAVGDVNSKMQLAYVAEKQAELAVMHMCGNESCMPMGLFPQCIYMDIEVAQIGMNSDQARDLEGFDVCSLSARSNSMANISGSNMGVCSLIIDRADGMISGIEMIFPNAVDIVGACSWMIEKGVSVKDLAFTLFPHPSYVEIVKQTAQKYLLQK